MQFSTLFLVAFASLSLAVPQAPAPELKDLDGWLANLYTVSLKRIDESMNQPGGAPGAVVAAPSKSEPDYFFFWVRDGSLTLDYIYHLMTSGNNPSHREQQLHDYATLSRKLQTTNNPSGEADGRGLGEPKFYLNGTAFMGPWGRPQDDGPAIRAYTLSRFANTLLAKDKSVDFLYKPQMPAHSTIKADLEYVAHNWGQTSFDIWEEVKGLHFYTRLVQRRALVEGAQLARKLKDNGAADFYDKQAKEIQASIERFWDGNRRLLVTTLNRDGGADYKDSQVDVQVVLAALHATTAQDDFYAPTSDRVQATAARVIESFRDLYNINRVRRDLGTAIGRYPEDKYTGTGTGVGHAWVLATAGMAEMYYKAATAYKQQGRIPVTHNNVEFLRYATRPSDNISLVPNESITPADGRFNALLRCFVREGDNYLARIRYHTAADGNLHEQMHRDTGYMTGAPHLTWSYVAFNTAYEARQAAKKLV